MADHYDDLREAYWDRVDERLRSGTRSTLKKSFEGLPTSALEGLMEYWASSPDEIKSVAKDIDPEAVINLLFGIYEERLKKDLREALATKYKLLKQFNEDYRYA